MYFLKNPWVSRDVLGFAWDSKRSEKGFPKTSKNFQRFFFLAHKSLRPINRHTLAVVDMFRMYAVFVFGLECNFDMFDSKPSAVTLARWIINLAPINLQFITPKIEATGAATPQENPTKNPEATGKPEETQGQTLEHVRKPYAPFARLVVWTLGHHGRGAAKSTAWLCSREKWQMG